MDHPLGTDVLGRDMLSRLIYGARTTAQISVIAPALGAVAGTIAGLMSGYWGGWADALLMRIADAALGFPIILLEAALSYLGLGLPVGAPAWGIMVAEGPDVILDVWWLSRFPGVAITVVALAFNFFGDWLRDYLDPKLRRAR